MMETRKIPSIDKIVTVALAQLAVPAGARPQVVAAARQVVAAVRQRLVGGEKVRVDAESLAAESLRVWQALNTPKLRPVINASGIVVHTNLGRAPLSARAAACVQAVLSDYNTLEYNLAAGQRGNRLQGIVDKLCALTGAEDALVVNNNAAAVLLVLAGLAQGREVIVSRGQLVEIGGSFRIPDVLAQSGARLVEVGTTNKTHCRDYARVIGPDTAAILKVHTSNYRVVGFTAQPTLPELAALAQAHALPLIEDLGSGLLLPLPGAAATEPTVAAAIAAGVDIVTFSGDKLLGGPQAGLIVGKKVWLDRLRQQPLLRALRLDKLSLAALEGTLLDYLAGEAALAVPVQRWLRRDLAEMEQLADALTAALAPLAQQGWKIRTLALDSQAGGGTLPEVPFASVGVGIRLPAGATWLERALRKAPVPVIARIQADELWLDMRCLTVRDIGAIAAACRQAVGGER